MNFGNPNNPLPEIKIEKFAIHFIRIYDYDIFTEIEKEEVKFFILVQSFDTANQRFSELAAAQEFFSDFISDSN